MQPAEFKASSRTSRIQDIFKKQQGVVLSCVLFVLVSSLPLEAEDFLPVLSSFHGLHTAEMSHTNKLIHGLGQNAMLVGQIAAVTGV